MKYLHCTCHLSIWNGWRNQISLSCLTRLYVLMINHTHGPSLTLNDWKPLMCFRGWISFHFFNPFSLAFLTRWKSVKLFCSLWLKLFGGKFLFSWRSLTKYFSSLGALWRTVFLSFTDTSAFASFDALVSLSQIELYISSSNRILSARYFPKILW